MKLPEQLLVEPFLIKRGVIPAGSPSATIRQRGRMCNNAQKTAKGARATKPPKSANATTGKRKSRIPKDFEVESLPKEQLDRKKKASIQKEKDVECVSAADKTINPDSTQEAAAEVAETVPKTNS